MINTYLLSMANYNPDTATFGDKLSYGGQMLLIGMLTVFAVLCVLWVCLIAFKFFFHDLPAGRTREVAVKPEVVTETVVYETDDGEIIAAIAAAIAMAECEVPDTKFRVVSFRRK